MATKTSPAKRKQEAKPQTAGAAQVKAVLEAGEGLLRLAPTWVPRSFLMPGRRIKLAPQDIYAYGAHRGGIDERWFASTTPAANENRVPDEGLSYIVAGGKRVLTLADAIAQEGPRMIGSALWETLPALAGVQQVLRQPRPDPAPHAPEPDPGGQGRPARQTGILLFPAPAQRPGQQLPLHLLRPGARHHQGRHRPLPRRLEQGRQRHPQLQQGLSLATRHRLAGPALRPARPGLAGHLRTAVGLRRLRHVPVAGRRPARALGPARQGHARRQAPRPRLPGRSARLGGQRQSELQGQPLSRTHPRGRYRLGRLCRSLDRLRQGRRRRSCSAPRS